MKRAFLSVLLTAVLLTACSNNDAPVEPAAAPDAMEQIAASIDRLNLTLEQAAQLDEMVFMEEDLSLLLDPVQEDAFNGLLDGGTRNFDPRRGIDIGAIIYYQLIVKANPDMDEETLTKLREMIAQSLQLRQRILQSGKSREEILRLLQDEHNKLIRQINQLIGPEAVARVERLKAQLEEEREKRREEWQQQRIERQVGMMTRLLGLTEEEANAVRRILTHQHEEMKRLRELYGENPEQFREALRTLQLRIDEAMKNAIGEKWERWKQLQQKRIDPRDHESPIEKRVKMMTDLLQLSERQAAAVKDILTKQHEEIQRLMRQYSNDREALAEALKALQQRIDAQIAKILTPEQLERWKRYKSGGGRGIGPRG